MSFSTKLENTYLNILRYVILAVATVSLVAVVIAGVMAVSAALSKPPEKIKIEDQAKDFKKGFTIDDFKKDNLSKAEGEPQEQSQEPTPAEKAKEDPFLSLINGSVSKIADNFITYQRVAHNIELNKEKTEDILRNFPINAGIRKEKPIFTFYFETLVELSESLARQAEKSKVGQALPEENKVDLDKLLLWHSKQVNKAVEAVDEANAQRNTEFQKQQDAYIEKKTLTFTYASFAGGAFGIFLIVIMLFIMVKIERNLRPLQQIVDNGKSPLTHD
jgi:hypothetical protein